MNRMYTCTCISVVSRICYWSCTVVRVATSLNKVAREVSLNKIADVAIHTCSSTMMTLKCVEKFAV